MRCIQRAQLVPLPFVVANVDGPTFHCETRWRTNHPVTAGSCIELKGRVGHVPPFVEEDGVVF